MKRQAIHIEKRSQGIMSPSQNSEIFSGYPFDKNVLGMSMQ